MFKGEDGKWYNDAGRLIKVTLVSEFYKPERDGVPLEMRVTYDVLTADGLATFAHKRADVDLNKMILDGVITQEQAVTYEEIQRAALFSAISEREDPTIEEVTDE